MPIQLSSVLLLFSFTSYLIWCEILAHEYCDGDSNFRDIKRISMILT